MRNWNVYDPPPPIPNGGGGGYNLGENRGKNNVFKLDLRIAHTLGG